MFYLSSCAPWTRLADEIADEWKGPLFGWAGYYLRAMGRLKEAIVPMQNAIKVRIQQGALDRAAWNACNLSELFVLVGNLEQAEFYARQGIQLANQCGFEGLRIVAQAKLATALHQLGQITEAAEAFTRADEMQHRMLEPVPFPFLYSIEGFCYCDFLLDQQNYTEAKRRAAEMLARKPRDHARPQISDFLGVALDHLTLGRAMILEGQPGASATIQAAQQSFQPAGTKAPAAIVEHLDAAVIGLRQAGLSDFLVLGLLARAWHRFLVGDLPGTAPTWTKPGRSPSGARCRCIKPRST